MRFHTFLKTFIYSLSILALLSSCENTDTTTFKDSIKSTGGIAEIIVVMDKEKWEGSVGDALREILEEEMPGLPQDEPRFKLIYIQPGDLKGYFNKHHHLLFVTLLDDNSVPGKKMKSYFTKESLEMIQKDEKLFMFTKNDENAKGQQTIHLFAKNDSLLIENIKSNKTKLLTTLYNEELKRIRKSIYTLNEQTKLSDYILKTHQINIRVPAGYDIAKDVENFIWIRYLSEPFDKSIYITYKPYTSAGYFNLKELIQWRDSLGYRYINDAEIEDSYMSTEVENLPVDTLKTTINSKFAMEYRGLWKLKNKTRGGAFLGYAFVDEKAKRFYYVEAFLYAPSQDKRNAMLEMEAILKTIQTMDMEQ